eukprot:278670_1
MASPKFIDAKLTSFIESVTCVADLTPLLDVMFGLTEMKNLVKQKLSIMNAQQKQKLYVKAAPMDEVLPEHIVQYMIGFTDLKNLELVNKSFRKYCNSVKRFVIRQGQTKWEKEFNELHSDLRNKRIINVYPSPHYNTLPLAIRHAQSGDTLLLFPGTYSYVDIHMTGECIEKNIKLIGYNSKAIIDGWCISPVGNDCFNEIEFCGKYSYIRNITLNMYGYCMCTGKKCSAFYLEDCVINSDGFALLVSAEVKTVKIKNCVVNCDDSGFVFYGSPELIEIDACVFENCCDNASGEYSHCIVLHSDSARSVKQAKFKCVGNHFKNNFGLPIVAENPSEINLEDTHILNNTWCYNQLDIVIPELRNDQVNPNKTYAFTQIQKPN